MLKKKIALALSLVMAVGLFSGCGANSSTSSSDEIKIGVVLALTGDVSTYGQSGKNGLELLQEETNKNGGILGKKVKFVYEDSEGKPASAANATQKLIDNDKVVAIVGPLTSSECISAGPIAVQNKIPMVTGTGTNPKVTDAGDYVFRTCFIDPYQGTVISNFAAQDLKAKTAAILFDNGNDYSKGLSEYFQKNFEQKGGKIIASETYNKGDQDFNAQLTKIKPLNPDVILLPDYYGTVGVIAKQARAMGIKATFLGGDGWDSADLYKIGGTAVEGSYFSDHYSPDNDSPEVVQFTKDYKTKYNTTPDAMAVLNYDAGKVLLESIKAAGKTDGDSIKDALKKADVKAVCGEIKFDDKRNAVKSAVIIKAEDGKNKFVKVEK
ncbi:MAG: ABC transporter substrate-binding protein [Bacillota bacterium]|nr:ABC transporter substrate-binding protein [Bacillota bacterium]